MAVHAIDAAFFAARDAGAALPEGTGGELIRQVALLRCVFGNPFRPAVFDPAWWSWNGRVVVALAQQMYDSRDFRMAPLLADALEDAGCTDPDILGHLRGVGPHCRGCWAVDLVLGKD